MKDKLFLLGRNILRSPVARNSGVMFAGTMTTNLGAYLYHVVVGRILGPERYGEFAALFSLLFIISVPSQVVQTILTKFFSVYKATGKLSQARALFLRSLFLLFGIGSIGFVLFYFLIPSLQAFLHIGEFQSFVWLYGVFFSFFVITLFVSLLNGYQRFFPSSLGTTITMFLRLLSGVLLAPLGVSLALLGAAAANLLSVIFFVPMMGFLLQAKKEILTLPKKEALLFSIPTLIAILGITLFYNFDVVLVKHFLPPQEAGIYAALTAFGKIVFFVSSPILLVMFPMVAERKELGRSYHRLVFTGILGVAGLSLSVALGYFLFSSFIATTLFGSKFAPVAPFLGAFGFFMALVGILNYLLTMCLAINKTKGAYIVLLGAFVQAFGITWFHTSVSQIIGLNIVVSSVTLGLLLLYYAHDSKVRHTASLGNHSRI